MTTNIEFDAVSNSWDEHTNAGENHISTGVQVAQAANGKAASEPVPVDAGSGAPATNQPAADAKAPASNAPASNANAPTGNAPATNAAASNVPHEYVVQAGNVVKLPANVSIDDIKVDGHNLVLVQPDGSEIIIKDGALNVPTFILGDVEVPRVALIAALEASHVDVAFGADGSISASGNGSTSSAGGNFDQPAGGIGNGFGLSPLLPPTDLAFGQPEHRDLFPGLVQPNRAPEIDVTPTSPNPSDGFNIVDESGLPTGSNPSDAAIHATGTIHMTDPDGAGDLKTVTVGLGGSTQTVNIADITGANSQTFNFTSGGAHGTLTITGYNAATGNATYTYTLTNPVHDATPNNGADTVSPGDTFNLTVTDGSGATGTANLVIDIKDDVPHAVADTNTGIEGATLNVSAANGVLHNDTPGADGYAAGGGLVGVRTVGAGNDTTTPVTTGIGSNIVGAYGTLTLYADGSYKYIGTPNVVPPAGATDTFVYTIKDGDGDLSTTTLKISLTDSGITASANEAQVNEAGLPTGSHAGDGSNIFTTGQITASSAAGGLTYELTTSATGSHGTLTLNPDGTYTYTLTSPVTESPANNGTDTVNHADSFGYKVTDANGNTVTGTIYVDVKDDVPTAVADTNTGIEGGTLNVNATNGVLHNDVAGADGYAAGGGVVGVAAGSDTSNPVSSGVGTIINGTYGTLTLYADGSYKYVGTPNVVPPAGATDTFVYTIKDGDGDLSTTTLKINLTDSGITASANEALVNEAGLPTGSHAGDGSNIFTTGQITASSAAGGLTYVLTTSATGSHGTLTLNPDGTYTYTLTSPVTESPAANNGTDTVNHADSFGYKVTDANGNTVTGTIYVDVKDDVPSVIAPDAAVMLNTAGQAFTGKLDFDGNVDNNYGADGGNTRFAASLSGTDSGFTSGGRHILYSVSADGHTLTGFLDSNGDSTYTAGTDTPVFTVTLNLDGSFAAANDTYTVNLIGTIDGGASEVNFSGSGYAPKGGNLTWNGFVPVGQTLSSPPDHVSQDLLITPIGSGTSVNNTNNGFGAGGGGGGQSIGSGEGLRFDYVIDLRGAPSASGSYPAPGQGHTFDGHYTVNGASMSFALNNGTTTAQFRTSIDTTDTTNAAGYTSVGDGTVTAITSVTISHVVNGITYSTAVDLTTPGTTNDVAVGPSGNQTHYIVTELTGASAGQITISNLHDGDVVATYAGQNYTTLDVSYVSGSAFNLTNFGTTTITPGQPVDLHLPVNVVDGDGDVANGVIGLYLMPSSPTTADHSADSAGVSHVYNATSSQPDVIGSLYDDTISAAGVSGNHILYGGAGGNDTLIGGAGNDTLIASSGNNTMTGGAGTDTFVINAATWTSGGTIHDLITDYHSSENDVVDLSKVLDAVFGGSQTDASSVSATKDGSGNVHIDVTHGGSTIEVATLAANAGISSTINIVYDDSHHASSVPVH